MAQGEYKNGVAIEVGYQAVNNATGKTVTMDVYDEAHAKDVPKCVASMTEIAATGRYYAAFTPDAEGIWTVVMVNTTDANGPVALKYAVAGHDVDSIGDAIAALNDLDAAAVNAEVDTALADYDGPTKAELDSGLAGLNDLDAAAVNAECDTALADYDAPTEAEMNAKIDALVDVTEAQVNAQCDTALSDYDAPTKAELDTSESNIRGADSDTLKDLSDQIDAVSAPAMAY